MGTHDTPERPRVCTDRLLPRDLARPHVTTVNSLGHIQAIAPIQKQWPNGSVLSVAFIGGTAAQHDQVKQYAPRWSQHANARFEFKAGLPAQIRIAFDPNDGAWSYIGTDALEVPATAPTMNFGWLGQDVILHEFGHCLAGNTFIDCPRDLKKFPKGIPIKDLVGTQPWVYAWKDGRAVVRRASRVWLSRRNAPTVRVKLSTGQGRHCRPCLPPLELIGTTEHPVLLVDGTWKKLGALKPGDRLCSLYHSLSKSKKRGRIRWTGSVGNLPEHAFVCEQVHGVRPTAHHAHHKNGVLCDNTPSNLEWKHQSWHLRDHSLGRKDSPETRQRRSLAKRGKPLSAEARANIAEAAKWRLPVSETTKAKLSAASRGKRQSEELRGKRAAAMRAYYANGGRSGMFGKKDSEDTRAKKRAAALEFYSNGGKSAVLGRTWSAERRAKVASAWQKKRELAAVNHVVRSVEPWISQDVYDMTVPDAESFVANGVVVHNCLSLAHEHQNPRGGIQWNEAAVIRDLSGPPNFWDEATIRHNVIEKYTINQITGTEFDPKSIMLYSFPSEWTMDGFSTGWNQDISALDGSFTRGLYPSVTVQLPVLPLRAGISGNIERVGQVREYDFSAPIRGDYVFETAGAMDVILSVYRNGALVRQDDDSGRGNNARIEATLDPGQYKIAVRHFGSGTGKFRLIAWG